MTSVTNALPPGTVCVASHQVSVSSMLREGRNEAVNGEDCSSSATATAPAPTTPTVFVSPPPPFPRRSLGSLGSLCSLRSLRASHRHTSQRPLRFAVKQCLGPTAIIASAEEPMFTWVGNTGNRGSVQAMCTGGVGGVGGVGGKWIIVSGVSLIHTAHIQGGPSSLSLPLSLSLCDSLSDSLSDSLTWYSGSCSAAVDDASQILIVPSFPVESNVVRCLLFLLRPFRLLLPLSSSAWPQS